MNKYIPIIGLEIHVQLDTKSKLFCGCNNESFGVLPNVNVCPVCSGQPGTLPVINKQALDYCILGGLALKGRIAQETKWDRKSYFYPDLPKGYQISQYDKPIVEGGEVEIFLENGDKKVIRLVRAHLEEDAGKSIHDRSSEFTYLDYNRCGTPLLEIVTEPDIASSLEAELFAKQIRRIMRYIGVSRVNMEMGHMRFDINVNVRVEGDNTKYTPIAEVKNLNSFRALVKAIDYEIKSQIEEFEKTGIEKSEGNKRTFLWNDLKEMTIEMRFKEEAADYRYFPDPDVMPVVIDQDWINQIKVKLPILPAERFSNYIKLDMSYRSAMSILENRNIADYLDVCLGKTDNNEALRKELVNWFVREIMSFLNELTDSERAVFDIETKISSDVLIELISLVVKQEVTRSLAKEWLVKIWNQESNIVDLKKNVSENKIDIGQIVDSVLNDNLIIVEQYKAGNEKVFNVLIGKMMKETKGVVGVEAVVKVLKSRLG